MWLGTSADGLYRVECPVALSNEQESRVTYHNFADGSRSASIFGSLASGREWTARYSAKTPGQMNLLESMATRPEWYRRGTGLQLIPTGGERVNLLTREESSLAGLTIYEPTMIDADGPTFGYAATDTGTRYIIGGKIPMPQTPGTVVTISGWTRTACRFMVYYRGANGSSVSPSKAFATPGSKTFTRKSVTVAIPDGVRHLDVQASGEITKPAVTLGRTLYAWGEGQRVPSVVVEQDGTETQWAGSRDPNAAVYTRHDYRITELKEGEA